MARLVS